MSCVGWIESLPVSVCLWQADRHPLKQEYHDIDEILGEPEGINMTTFVAACDVKMTTFHFPRLFMLHEAPFTNRYKLAH